MFSILISFFGFLRPAVVADATRWSNSCADEFRNADEWMLVVSVGNYVGFVGVDGRVSVEVTRKRLQHVGRSLHCAKGCF